MEAGATRQKTQWLFSDLRHYGLAEGMKFGSVDCAPFLQGDPSQNVIDIQRIECREGNGPTLRLWPVFIDLFLKSKRGTCWRVLRR